MLKLCLGLIDQVMFPGNVIISLLCKGLMTSTFLSFKIAALHCGVVCYASVTDFLLILLLLNKLVLLNSHWTDPIEYLSRKHKNISALKVQKK